MAMAKPDMVHSSALQKENWGDDAHARIHMLLLQDKQGLWLLLTYYACDRQKCFSTTTTKLRKNHPTFLHKSDTLAVYKLYKIKSVLLL